MLLSIRSTSIKQASAEGDVEAVKYFLSCDDANPSVDNNYAVRIASTNGHVEVVKLLLSWTGVDLAAEDNAAIKQASFNGHADVVELLLSHDSTTYFAINEALNEVKRQGNKKVAKVLLTGLGPYWNTCRFPKTNLLEASRGGNLKIIKYLLYSYRKINLDTVYRRAIQCANQRSQNKVVKFFLYPFSLMIFGCLYDPTSLCFEFPQDVIQLIISFI